MSANIPPADGGDERAVALKSCPVELPQHLHSLIAAMPEHSYGVSRVTLILDDGSEVDDVYVGWGIDVLRVGESKELVFDAERVVGARHQP